LHGVLLIKPAAGHPLTGWHGAGGVGVRLTLKTLAFIRIDGNSCRTVTTKTPNGALATPNRNCCKFGMTFGMEKKYTLRLRTRFLAAKKRPAEAGRFQIRKRRRNQYC
jgi:hypothetical protein